MIQCVGTIAVEPDLIFVLDQQGICHEYLTHNALLSQNGSTLPPRNQAIGQAIDTFLPTAFAAQLHSRLALVDQTGDAFDYTGQSLWTHINNRWSQDTATARRQPDSHQLCYAIRLTHCGAGRILCVIRDVTQSRQLDAQLQQEQTLEAIGRLAGGVAHDFNNILTVIANYSELVLSLIPRSNPLYSKIEQIQQAGARAAHLTQQLLTFSRRQRSELEVLDLNTVLQSFEPILRRLLGEEISWSSTLATDLHPIKADRGQLKQLLTNLTMNARDAMPQGGLLSIRTQNVHLTQADLPAQTALPIGEYVQLTVQDSGHGIDPAIRSHLFEPFFTTKEVGQGTGLGLSTVYGIVNQHQGFIDVESAAGAGALFHIYLPRTDEPFPSSVTPAADDFSSTGTATESHKKTIFVVDDEQPILSLMAMIREEAGYTVLQANSAPEALDVAAQRDQPIDLLLSDMVMPGMNGHELYEALLSQRPELRVVFVSGYTEVRILPHGRTSARISFLGKPFTWQQLLQKVEEMINE